MKKKKKVLLWSVVVLVVGLIGLRIALPTLVQRYVNNKLDELPEYDGRVGDIDIHLIRGAYSIDNVDIVKTTGEVPIPFFEARRVEFSMEWRELFHGALVGEIKVERGRLNFVKGESKEDSQTSIDDSWLQVVQDLFPFRINRFEIRESEVWFRDLHSEPKVDVYLTNLVAVCTNLYNTRKLQQELPADFKAHGYTLGEGELELHVKLDPLSKDPQFDLELAVKDMDLVALNDLLEAYGKFDVKRGRFECFVEIAASEGQFSGYVKPFFDDLDIFELKTDSENPLKMAWQAIVAGAMKIFQNQPKDQVATRIPVSGNFEKTEVNVWVTIANILRNAFVQGFSREVDDSVNLFNKGERAEEKEEE